MKIKVLIIIFISLLFGTSFYSCTKETIVYDNVSQKEANKQLVQTISTNLGTGFNTVFKSLYSDSVERAVFVQNFCKNTRFFNDRSGYVVVESNNGYNIVYPPDDAMQGTYTLNTTDANGKLIVADMVAISENIGFGFLEYYYNNPITHVVEKKFSFVKAIPSANWYTLTGFYDSDDTYLTRTHMIEQVVESNVGVMAQGFEGIFAATSLDSLQGVELIRTMLSNIRFFDDQSGYFYVLDYNGYNVAQPPAPEIQGTNEWDIQDSQGNYLVRGLIETAKSGGGYYEYYWPNYQTGNDELKRAYVLPISGKDYLIGSGVYSGN
ncbi:MAG: hypothetical protein CVT99_03635 [Bacteroidetes bacterium HGW-Bacteroidetes-16]|jgi:signal transduction histidine kinase|nr:MAG: hypothetical protein CVT99_03635 [Bacteroidetes bacterium HGW-Bacteroidetes-16]